MPVEVVDRDVEEHRDVGRNAAVVSSSWNDDTSATTTSTGSSHAASSSGRPMLPAAIARTPDAVSISAISVVTVVFPLVPVTATSRGASARPRSRSAARSISDRTGDPAAASRTMAGWSGHARARHDQVGGVAASVTAAGSGASSTVAPAAVARAARSR